MNEAAVTDRRTTLRVGYDTVVGVVAGTRDWFPGHHDPAYARAQGKRDIYLNTAFYQGFIDRAALEHCGERSWIVSRELRMIDSVYPGDVLTAELREEAHSEGDDEGMVNLTVNLVTGEDAPPCVVGKVTVRVVNEGAVRDE